MDGKENLDETKLEQMHFYAEQSRAGIVISAQATDDQLNVVINNQNASKPGRPDIQLIGLKPVLSTLQYCRNGYFGIAVHNKENIKFVIDALNSELAELRQQIAMRERNNEQH